MATSAYDVTNLLQKKDKYTVFIAEDEGTKQLCYKLRYDILAKKNATETSSTQSILYKDKFDDYSHQLVVYDNRINEIIATTRLLDNDGRKNTGIFYSETEFDLSNIINNDANFLEVGHTCIHPAYNPGSVLVMLWRGIVDLIISKKIDYLIGCASIPLSGGDKYISSIMSHIQKHHYAPESLRVHPLVPLRLIHNLSHTGDAILPELLKAYVRQGALVCGQPYWDASLGIANVFVLLEAGKIVNRYLKHPVNTKQLTSSKLIF